MYKYSSLFLCFFIHFSEAVLKSTEVLIKAPKTSWTEFSAYADTEAVKTFAQYQLEQIYKSPRPIVLADLLEKSQREFLSYEPERAKKTYQSIINHIHSFDWTEPERKIIVYALFRMAQLERNLQKQKMFLQEAVVFGGNSKIDTTLFPPPVVQTYLNLKKSMHFAPVNLKKIFPEHEQVLINGKVHSSQQKLLLPYGVYRVRALSSARKSWLKILSLSRLLTQKIKSPYLVNISSSCQKARLNQEIQKPKQKILQVLFPNFCIWNEIQARAMLADKSAGSAKEGSLEASELKSALKPKLTENFSQKHKKKWVEPALWFGGAIALSTLTFFVLKNKKKPTDPPPAGRHKPKSNPSVTVGF